jgi:hypothetical protein
MLSRCLAIFCALLWVTVPAGATDPIADLMSSPASKYDLGLFRLSDATKEWAASHKEQPGIRVLMSKNKQNGIDFYLDPSFPLRDARSKAQAESICRQIGQSFVSMILGNYGEPSEKNVNGDSIYLMTWGSYFASSEESNARIQEIGKAISAGSRVRVSTGRQDIKECSYVSGDSYKRVPYT